MNAHHSIFCVKVGGVKLICKIVILPVTWVYLEIAKTCSLDRQALVKHRQV